MNNTGAPYPAGATRKSSTIALFSERIAPAQPSFSTTSEAPEGETFRGGLPAASRASHAGLRGTTMHYRLAAVSLICAFGACSAESKSGVPRGAAGAAGAPPVPPTLAGVPVDPQSFAVSECKTQSGAPVDSGTGTPAMAPGYDTASLEGFSCLAWHRVGADGLRIDLVNFGTACYEPTVGLAAIDGASLGLDININTGFCIDCLRDWSFGLGSMRLSGDLPVVVRVNEVSQGFTAATRRVTLPLSTEPEGAFCDALPHSRRDSCRVLGSECGYSSFCYQSTFVTPTCDAGLACAAFGTDPTPYCLQACASDPDCHPAFVCVDGACKPARLW
jgi:hypothetical protein